MEQIWYREDHEWEMFVHMRHPGDDPLLAWCRVRIQGTPIADLNRFLSKLCPVCNRLLREGDRVRMLAPPNWSATNDRVTPQEA